MMAVWVAAKFRSKVDFPTPMPPVTENTRPGLEKGKARMILGGIGKIENLGRCHAEKTAVSL